MVLWEQRNHDTVHLWRTIFLDAAWGNFGCLLANIRPSLEMRNLLVLRSMHDAAVRDQHPTKFFRLVLERLNPHRPSSTLLYAELVIEALRRRIRQLHPICFKLNQNKGTYFQIRLESDSGNVRNRKIWNAETVTCRPEKWIGSAEQKCFHARFLLPCHSYRLTPPSPHMQIQYRSSSISLAGAGLALSRPYFLVDMGVVWGLVLVWTRSGLCVVWRRMPKTGSFRVESVDNQPANGSPQP